MPKYSWQAPDGHTLTVEQDAPPTPRQIQAVMQAYLDSQKPPTPRGERVDRNMISVNHDWIANQASKLPEGLQWPVAAGGSFAGHVLESLASPENVVAMSADKLMPYVPNVAELGGRAVAAMGRGVEGLGNLLNLPSRYVGAYHLATSPAKAVLDVAVPPLMRRGGQVIERAGNAIAEGASGPAPAEAVSGDVPRHLNLSTPIGPSQLTPEQFAERTSAAAANQQAVTRPSTLRAEDKLALEARLAKPLRSPEPAAPTEPPAAAPEPPAPPSPTAAPAKPTIVSRGRGAKAKPAPEPVRSDIMRAFQDFKPTPEEAVEATKLLERGIPAEKVLEQLRLGRQLSGQLGTPTVDEVAKDLAYRRARD